MSTVRPVEEMTTLRYDSLYCSTALLYKNMHCNSNPKKVVPETKVQSYEIQVLNIDYRTSTAIILRSTYPGAGVIIPRYVLCNGETGATISCAQQ